MLLAANLILCPWQSGKHFLELPIYICDSHLLCFVIMSNIQYNHNSWYQQLLIWSQHWVWGEERGGCHVTICSGEVLWCHDTKQQQLSIGLHSEQSCIYCAPCVDSVVSNEQFSVISSSRDEDWAAEQSPWKETKSHRTDLWHDNSEGTLMMISYHWSLSMQCLHTFLHKESLALAEIKAAAASREIKHKLRSDLNMAT